ncbi:hypothetical protein QZH41_018145, partial [Actinostola sp. cb2023]
YQVISTPTDIFMVMEFVSGGELFEYILKHGKILMFLVINFQLEETEARRFFQQIISGVDYCHRHAVVHRDLKPENLLLDSHRNVKIADFGLSNIMKDGEFLQTSCGSPNYAAPEVISGKLYAGPEVDIWSCGVILYALLCGTLPFDDEHIPTLFRKIKGGVFHLPPHLNKDISGLISKTLLVDPMKRATIQDIREHDWFKKDLAPYLFPTTENINQRVIDNECLSQVSEKLKCPKTDIVAAIESGDPHDQLRIAYDLVLDNKKMRLLGTLPTNPTKKQPYLKLAQGKRPKWHLGIRSQSKPNDIMSEVYRAMVMLGYEWKLVNPFHLRVLGTNKVSGKTTKISLQLYQVDPKSYLLDFKSIPSPSKNEQSITSESDRLSRRSSANSSCSSLKDCAGHSAEQIYVPVGHHTLDFLEMCSNLIIALAC